MDSVWFVILMNLSPMNSTMTDRLLTTGTNDVQECARTAMIAQAQLFQMKADREFVAVCKKLVGV